MRYNFRYNVIPILADIQSESVKEKVIRIILATFRVRLTRILRKKKIQLKL